jgi:hypothetical protein
MIPEFNDNHRIDDNFQKLKFLIQQAEEDVYKFIGPTRNRKAGRRSRKKLIKIKELAHKISIGIMHQGQDFDSEY